MEYTVDLQDGADLHLTDVGVTTQDEQIAFSIDGRIDEIDDELMEIFSDKSLKPVAITFEAKETNEE